MMTNYTYQNMNAHDLANEIIESERRFLETDFESLDLVDQCAYIENLNPFHHPLAAKKRSAEELIAKVLPALVELQSVQDGGHGDVLYYTTLFSPDFTYRETLMKSAVEEQSLNAAIFCTCHYRKSDLTRERKLIEDYVKFSKSIPESFRTVNGDVVLYECYSALADLAKSEKEREYYSSKLDSLALSLVKRGVYAPLSHLCVKNPRTKDQNGKPIFDEETLFFKTVAFLVDDALFNQYGVTVGDLLGIKLLRGIGCDRDVERAKAVYLHLYRTKSFDPVLLRQQLHIDCDTPIDQARQARRLAADHGDVTAYCELILLAILAKDDEALEAICDEAIAHRGGELMRIFPTAYVKLSFANPDLIAWEEEGA